MCFSSSPTTPAIPTAADYAYYDTSGAEVPGNSKGATRKLRPTKDQMNILGASWNGGSDSAGNSVGVGTDASGNSNAGSSASGW